MSKSKKDSSRLVFSTESGRHCPDCGRAKAQCQCNQASVELGDGIVRIRRETKGRGGKAVTTISGIPLAGPELKALAKSLKKTCGTGGAIKDQTIEIQGDQRDKCRETLEKAGYTVKLAGG